MNWTLKMPTSFILVGMIAQQAHSCRGDIHFTGLGCESPVAHFLKLQISLSLMNWLWLEVSARHSCFALSSCSAFILWELR